MPLCRCCSCCCRCNFRWLLTYIRAVVIPTLDMVFLTAGMLLIMHTGRAQCKFSQMYASRKGEDARRVFKSSEEQDKRDACQLGVVQLILCSEAETETDDEDIRMLNEFTALEQWLRDVGVSQAHIPRLLDTCDKEMIGCIADVINLHDAGDLEAVFPKLVCLRIDKCLAQTSRPPSPQSPLKETRRL